MICVNIICSMYHQSSCTLADNNADDICDEWFLGFYSSLAFLYFQNKVPPGKQIEASVTTEFH